MDSQHTSGRVYLASALSNGELNHRIAASILSLGFDCYVPQEDPVNRSGRADGELIAAKNRQEIESCSLMVAVYRNMGCDTSWEIGYAKGLGKQCCLLCDLGNIQEARRSVMPFFSVDAMVAVSEWNVPVEDFAREIERSIDHLPVRKMEVLSS